MTWRITIGLAAALAGCSNVVATLDVSYDERHGDATTMDIYQPPDGQASTGVQGAPAVLLVHGGGWHSFSKESMTASAQRLAEAGFVSASINYRLVPDGSYPNNIHDVMCALAFFRSQADTYGFDPDRIAVMGYSAGGHLASLLGVATDVPEFSPDCAAGPPAPPRAVISGAGPQDMNAMPEVDAVTDFLGGTRDEVPEVYDLASPITHVGRDEPPFLFIHGSGDLFVALDHSERMKEALIEAGNQASLLELSGGGHLLNAGPSGGQVDLLVSTDTPEAWAATIDFLDRTLGAP